MKQSLWQDFQKTMIDHSRTVIGSVAGVLVLCACLGLYLEWRSGHEAKATNALYVARQASEKAIAAKDNAGAEAPLRDLIQKFPRTHAAFEAALALGDFQMQNKVAAEAAKSYDMAVNLAKDEFTRMLALYDRGVAQEAAKQCEEAVKSYDAAIRAVKSDTMRPEIMMAEARCYETLNNAEKAIALYKEVQEKFSGRAAYYSNAAAAYERRLTDQKTKAD